MDGVWIGLVCLVIGIVGGGYLGYRYGRSVEATAREIKKVL